MGSRVGTKRSDRRYQDDSGNIWASEFEFRVCRGLQEVLGEERVRQCDERDTMHYTSHVKQGVCLSCGHDAVAQKRQYTPDIRISKSSRGKSSGCYIETKGFLAAPKRTLLKEVAKQWEYDVPLIFIFQNNRKWRGVKRTPTQWAESFLKCPAFVWDGKKTIPQDLLEYLNDML